MCIKLLAAFIGIPLIELFILIRLGSHIGFWPTVAVQIVTGVVGAALAKYEGMAVLVKIQVELAQGRMPAARMVDGLLILAAGIVLLTPGLLTDAGGLFLLIPFSRKWVREYLLKRFRLRVERGRNIYTVNAEEENVIEDED